MKGKQPDVEPILLNGDPLPWVQEVKHLGNTLQADNSMKTDCILKRGRFIGKVNSLLQEFHFVDSSVFVNLLKIYASSFYVSNLWNLYSPEVDRIYKSWNVTVRNVFGLPWTTHRYWIEPVSGCQHPKTFLSSRYVKFVSSLSSCNKSAVRYLASLCQGDNRTLLGRTTSRIALESNVGLENLQPNDVKLNLKYFPVPEEQEWRVSILSELLDVRSSNSVIENLTLVDVNQFIDIICTS